MRSGRKKERTWPSLDHTSVTTPARDSNRVVARLSTRNGTARPISARASRASAGASRLDSGEAARWRVAYAYAMLEARIRDKAGIGITRRAEARRRGLQDRDEVVREREIALLGGRGRASQGGGQRDERGPRGVFCGRAVCELEGRRVGRVCGLGRGAGEPPRLEGLLCERLAREELLRELGGGVAHGREELGALGWGQDGPELFVRRAVCVGMFVRVSGGMGWDCK